MVFCFSRHHLCVHLLGDGEGRDGGWGVVEGRGNGLFFCLPDTIRYQHEVGACVLLVCVERVRKHAAAATPGLSEREVGSPRSVSMDKINV